jgi:2-amino-4-hydroxy-6-hydroxymethyldihydropteridine diphosphokinase
MAIVAISLGSNLGDRRAHLLSAVEELGRLLRNLRASDTIETEPEDVPGPQPPYLNMAAVGETDAAPPDLLAALLEVERRQGRTRPVPRAPRTLDLDLILYGDLTLDLPDLTVPHPMFRRRRFVLEPLASIAPDLVDPVTRLTVRELLDRLSEKTKGA